MQGLNIIGYMHARSGLGEAVRRNHRAALKANVSVQAIDFGLVLRQEQYDLPYDYNLVQIGVADLELFFSSIKPDFFKQKYSVLYLMWESEYLPERYHASIRMFNELWTASSYCQQIFKKLFHGPVITIPHPVTFEPQATEKLNWARWMDSDKFSFLFIFSYHSSVNRKNPFFLIEAFQQAFGSEPQVELLIKTTGAKDFPDVAQEIMKKSQTEGYIKVLDQELGENEVHQLIEQCDCYVSLHHSEGFGLTLAEAMYLGKPVLATGYSGNMQFMDKTNSFLVKTTSGAILQPDANFCARTIWGHPDLEDAILKLRMIYYNREMASEKSKKGREDVQSQLSFETVGHLILERLNTLNNSGWLQNPFFQQQAVIFGELRAQKMQLAKQDRELARMRKNLIIKFVMILKNGLRQFKQRKIKWMLMK